jgi:2-succinyl-5-enolpyruvyl-6-hydroxy-3-cyclohexene-1-carboxylate synthase
MHFQPIFDIAELCAKKGVDTAVLCPGSRCAPLTLAFTRNPKIKSKTFSDERSAGFIGLGLAQQHKKPVVLICTSGSAAYNFAPAVAEAFFSETPMIIFTADRPAEWVAQHDGQTIFQPEIFGKHVKRSYQLPQDYDHADSVWAINRIVNEAVNLSKQYPPGPVHINAPFREPLYPGKEEVTTYSEDIRVIETHNASAELTEEEKTFINKEWQSHHKVLIVAAQGELDHELVARVTTFAESRQIPCVVDIISNFNGSPYPIRHSDLFLGQASEHLKKTLQPDLLITFGKSLISKNLKLFLRRYAPKKHWHLQTAGIAADTFKNLTNIFAVDPLQFFEHLSTVQTPESFESQKQKNYCKLWEVEERRALRALKQYFPLESLTELEIVKDVLQLLPENSNLHLSNSMSVRYANFIGIGSEGPDKNIEVFANRGTSGIDGSSSTSVGHALADPNALNVLITGDLAFFYDRNAFWHNYDLPNLRILLLNNHGGLIFNMIDGPASQPESSEYFITKQKLNALKLCEEFGFEYLRLDNKRKLKNLLKDFFDPEPKTKILEVETDLQLNRNTFDNLKQKIKESYES